MSDSVSEAPAEAMFLPLDREAQSMFDVAFRNHHASLVQYLHRRVGSEAEAADIAQEAYLRVLRYRGNQDFASLKALLYRIAINLVIMRRREAAAHHLSDHVPLDDLAVASAEVPHDQRLDDQQRLASILSAIKCLPDKCRHVFLLSRFHGMSNREIAVRCGISVRMVEKQISKALAVCRARVRDFGA